MLKIRIASVIFSSIFLCMNANGQEKESYLETGSGIEVPIKNSVTGIKKIRLQPVTDQIIHVTATSTNDFPADKSLMAVQSLNTKAKFTTGTDKDKVLLITAALKVEVSTESGLLTYHDLNGKLLLEQSKIPYRALVPEVFNGEPSYQVSQIFNTQENEAYYGLGQHQQGLVNYKGRRVDLVQYNTEIGIPFLLSNKGYGILWDNYSITHAGDIRDYQPLSAMRLFSKKGDEGWLTATYADKKKPEKVLLTRAVSDISMNWLTDQHLFPDTVVKMASAVVNYEGAVASSLGGLYQLQLKYAGYIKVWADGKLIADYWRQAWNPGSAILDLNLEKDKKTNIKIEWVPDGNVSYIGLTCLPPIPEEFKNTFALSSESGAGLNYYFISGTTADQVIGGYRTITGKAVLMPKWAMGFWQSRERYKTQDEILTTVKEFRDRKIPLDNIVLDWSYWKEPEWGNQQFDPARFPAPAEMMKTLHAQHANLMISVWAKFNKGIEAYNDFDQKKFLYKRNIEDGTLDWIGPGYSSTFYDAYNPAARTAFWSLMNKGLYSKGVDAWWMDATEPDLQSNLPVSIRKELMTPTYEGSSTTYFSAFALMNAKGIYEGQRKVNHDKRVFILTRSAYAGLQRYAAAAWSGDIASRWDDMKNQIGAGINFSLSGLPYWTMDIGGFSVETRYVEAEAAALKGQPAALDEWRELNTRWYQFGAFVPLFRVHGQFPYREIYNIAPENHPAYKSMLYYNQLRYRLMPYIYSLAGNTYQKDYTIMRGLVMDFPADLKAASLNDEFMFGPSLLINPVYAYKARSRSVYLPAGQGWYYLYTGKYFKGGQEVAAQAAYDKIPVFVKEGSILPTGPELQYTSEKPADPLTLYVYTGKDASFSLYEDEGTNYNYEKGAFSTIDFSYNEAAKTMTLGSRTGSFEGMLQSRTIRIIVISPKLAKGLNFTQKAMHTLSYTGKELVIKL